VLTSSGYGVHARQIAKWLLSIPGVDVTFQPVQWGITPWILDANECDGLIEQIVKRSVPPSGTYDMSFQLQLPNEWDPKLALFNVGITAAVETDKCNPKWIDACNAMNVVIVPSQHTLRTLRASGDLKVITHVVPEAVGDAFHPLANEHSACFLNTPSDFNFLVLGQITGNNPLNDRKNTFFTLKWLCETFKGNSNVGIVLKTNVGTNTFIDRKSTRDLVAQLLREVRKDQFPKVNLLHGRMTDAEVASLYCDKRIRALVSLTRGEGFGLPLLEAAACDLPVIATDWSAHTEFLGRGKFIKVDYALSQVHASRVDGAIFMEGTRWAEPLEADAKRKLNRFYEKPKPPEEWAIALGKTIRENYSFTAMSNMLSSIFKELAC
jgi:hypothetical protein